MFFGSVWNIFIWVVSLFTLIWPVVVLIRKKHYRIGSLAIFQIPIYCSAFSVFLTGLLIVTQLPALLSERDPQSGISILIFLVFVNLIFPSIVIVINTIKVFGGNFESTLSDSKRNVFFVGFFVCIVSFFIFWIHSYNSRLLLSIMNSNATPQDIRSIYEKANRPWVKSEIKMKIAGHRHVPADVIEKILSDGNESLRIQLAKNPVCSVSEIRRLSNDTCSWVRFEIASRSDCPIDVLNRLCNDPQSEIRGMALKQKRMK